MAEQDTGIMVVSLDFELSWGILGLETASSYVPNVTGARRVIPKILQVFEGRGIHATWAVVGALFATSREDYLAMAPARTPKYVDRDLTSHDNYLETRQEQMGDDCFFANALIHEIMKTPHQEIASHTFSHYYCTEKGQTLEDFHTDLRHAQLIARREGVSPTTLVFPRNEYNPAYEKALLDNGFVCYRGNERSWLYGSGNTARENPIKRVLRLIDSYIDISGHHCYPQTEIVTSNNLSNVRASRFLRPFHPRLRLLEPLKIHRIKTQMLHAAVHGEVFHLWWHPHNFGVNSCDNMRNLTLLLDYYETLRKTYGFRSLNMREMCNEVNAGAVTQAEQGQEPENKLCELEALQ